jgi:hypothetical protein
MRPDASGNGRSLQRPVVPSTTVVLMILMLRVGRFVLDSVDRVQFWLAEDDSNFVILDGRV